MKSNRVIVITGAAGGIGTPLTARFLGNADTVIATDLSDEALKRLAERMDHHSALHTVAADLSAEPGAARLAEFARDVAGHVDVIVNAAGHFPLQPYEEITPGSWRRVLDINLTGPHLIVQALLPLMKHRGWGRVINFGSGSVFDGTRSQTHYVAAKAGVVGFTRSLARELGPFNITANVIAPGLTVTEQARSTFPEPLLEAQRQARAIQRDQQPDDLVGPVFFLASPDADFITGQTVNVDGGKFMP
ncbi:SDR family NAD(P)-dependent oxidoreductase [Sphaerimonospora sp. CA-214678]|uniref:SDR family NAD(P)-dependent oxidoreductase n=1 Tax=Sphaerimonospora sp. CA-214678 TaxID=3240029 RepID=UPI003D8A90A4